MKAKVSVIIPTYGSNTDPMRAVSSVLNQHFPYVEVIVVDDNGKCSQQQMKNESVISKINDKRVIYITHEENLGGSAARNTGFFASNGEYICFLDDDDEFTDSEKIGTQVKEIEILDESWAGTYSSCDVYEENKLYEKIIPQKSGKLLYDYLIGEVRIETACPIIRRNVIEAIGGFDTSFKRHQDWEFFSRVLDCYKLKAVPQVTYSRYIKMDVARKPASVRLEYMDKFANSMRCKLKSLDCKTLDSALKHKYLQVIFVMIREMEFSKAFEIMKNNGYSLLDYLMVVVCMCNYVWKKVSNGKIFS